MFFLSNFKKTLLVKASLKFLNFFTLKNLKKKSKLNKFFYQKYLFIPLINKMQIHNITIYQCIDCEIGQKYLF
jgi:hypothetical protein